MTVDTDLSARASIALGSSYDQLHGALAGWFRARRIPSEEANDLAQDTIVRTFVHLKRHGPRGDDLKPLGFTIARNLLAERARRANGVVVSLTDEIDVADSELTPLDHVLIDEERSAVRSALGALGPRHRRVIELWMRGDAPADIARALGIKRNAADALLHRARRRLAVLLEGSRGAFGAVVGLLPLRLRLAMRRVNASIATFDPSGGFASVAVGLTAIGMTAVLAAGPSVSRSVHAPTVGAPMHSVVSSLPAHHSTSGAQKPSAATAPPSGSSIGAAGTDVEAAIGPRSGVGVWSAGTNSGSGHTKRRGFGVTFDHGSGTPVDDALTPVIGTACGTFECK